MALDRPISESLDVLVPGMKCAGCMTGIERALHAVPGVVQARSNLTQRRVRIEYTPAATDPDALLGALQAAGWQARPFDSHGTGQARDDRAGRDLLLRIGVAGFAAMNVMLLSVSVWSGADGPTRDMLHWISALVALPAMVFSGMPFFRSAFAALAARRINMDMPITVAIALSAVSSMIETAQSGEHAYFDAGIMLVFFLLIGRYLDHRTRARARSSVAELDALTARTVMRLNADGSQSLCPVESLTPGMEIAIAPGERIPADAVVTDGSSDLDRALVTGESVPEPVAAGGEVHAGMVNLTGPLIARVTAIGDSTVLAEIARMVDAAERGRTRYDQLADRAARIYAPGVHLAALLAFVGWMAVSGDWQLSLQIATAVLIITCPCALGLAVPTVHTVASGRLFRAGVFLKDGAELERLAEVDTVVFDKTGTLTEGTPRLTAMDAIDAPAMAIAMALAEGSRHPYARAIHAHLTAQGITPAALTDRREHPGLGVEGHLDGAPVRLGRPDWTGLSAGDHTLGLHIAGQPPAGFRFTDAPKADAAQVCTDLTARGLDVHLLSGDRMGAVGDTARQTGIATWQGELSPADKHARIAALQADGHKVLMIGDGLNDCPALAAAHASMSPSSAADISKTAAGLVFTSDRLGAVVTAIDTARTARLRAMQSFGFAAVYNLCAIPLALFGFVTPLIAALAMSGSSVVVILNALRMKATR